MQLAGAHCPLCSQKVLIESDATWCARCSTVMHRDCLTAADNLCPRCTRGYDAPESHFVYSKKCPECFRLNDPPRDRCGWCKAGTRWDSPAAYDEFRAHMRRTSRRSGVLGLVEVLIGALFFLFLAMQPQLAAILKPVIDRALLIIFFFPGGFLLFLLFIAMGCAFLFIAMKMFIQGFRNLVRSRKCTGFE